MTPFFRITCFLVFIISSGCSKKVNTNASDTHHNTGELNNVSGSWELHSQYGGNRMGNNGEVPPGNGDVYTFINNHFEHYKNHKLLDSGVYAMSKSKGPEQGDLLDAFVFNHSDTVLFILSEDTLILNPRAPMYDGVASKYVRVYLH